MRTPAVLRALLALGLCLGVGSTTLAAKSGPTADPAAAVVASARSHLGDPYVWGGSGPEAWDCSGLVAAAWRDAGGVRAVPRVSRDQFAWAVPIPVEQVLPGDLAFFGNPVTHVGLVTSRAGTGLMMVDAAASRHAVVERPVWRTGVVRFGRVPRPTMPKVLPWTPAPLPPSPVLSAPAPATLPGRTAVAGTPRAMALAALARKAVGTPDVGDTRFVQQLWRAAGGAALPTSRDALVTAGRPVALAAAHVGDLVVYGPPAVHVGIYVGNGLMVDSSRSKGSVLLRPVWPSPALRMVRLPG